jgi:hypothetical protein
MSELMFEDLKRWPRILVTGPQRAGTQITARMIAHDTGHKFRGENAFFTDSLNALWELLRTSRNVSVQCPALCRYVHILAANDPGILVVMCIRDRKEIAQSQARIRWAWGQPELIRYGRLEGSQFDAKYSFWNNFQKDALKGQGMEVRYDSLSNHPLWIPAEDRKDFEPRQVK